MYAKTCAIAFIAIWLFNASSAAPAPEPEPEAQPDPCGGGHRIGCGVGCGVTKVQTVPVSSNIPIKTTHRILADNGCGGGWGSWNGGYGCGSGLIGCGGGLIGGYGGLIGGCGWDSGCYNNGWEGGWGNGWEGGCGDCVVTRIHHIPLTSHIPVKTTHRVVPHNDCGSNAGWGTSAGYGNGCGCGCGCNGWL